VIPTTKSLSPRYNPLIQLLCRSLSVLLLTNNIAQANYISAEPHVSATGLQTDKDDFLIIGCDGVWDVVNYQEVRTFALPYCSTIMRPLMFLFR
jgi:serine/threonine protein phosphatase PrpC